MLGAAPQLVASVLLVVIFSAFKHKWQATLPGQLFAFVTFAAVQAGSVVLILLPANTTLAATASIIAAVCFSAAILFRPLLRWWRGIQTTSINQKKKRLPNGFF